MFNIQLAAALALTALLLWQYIITPAFLSPLSRIPAAHPTAHVSRLWILSIRWRNIENNTLLRLHRQLGPIIRLAPNELSVNCYEGGIKTIYGGSFPKHEFYIRRFMSYNTPNMFCMLDNKDHSIRKRMISNVYSRSYIMNSENIKATSKIVIFDRLLPILERSVETQRPVEMCGLSYAYSMDSFMAVQFGAELGSNFIQDAQEREWYLDAFFSRRPWFFWSDEFPEVVGFLLKFGVRLIPKWADDKTDELAAWNLRKCDAAEEMLSSGKHIEIADEPVFFAKEREALRKWEGKSYSSTSQASYPYRLDLASDAYDHNAAAMETSGDTLAYVFYELSKRLDLQRSLHEELLSLKPQTLTEVRDLPDLKALDSLPLLAAIIQETLRRWPATAGSQPRMSPSNGCSLAGYDNIPPNVKVMSSPFVLHQNPEVFPEPEKWNPYRWLHASPEHLREMNHWFWAWGSGGRMCIGNNFAMNSMKLAIAAMYTKFTTNIVDAGDMQQAEGFTSGPRGKKLVLQFSRT